MSNDDEQQAQIALEVLAGLECDEGGGPIDRMGHCAFEEHAHCPYCGGNSDCPHYVAEWNDGDGYSGPSFPARPEADHPIWQQPELEVRAALGSLSPLWDFYVACEDGDEPTPDELFDTAIEILDVGLVSVRWCQNDHPGGSWGYCYFAPDGAAVISAVTDLSGRLEAQLQTFASTHRTRGTDDTAGLAAQSTQSITQDSQRL